MREIITRWTTPAGGGFVSVMYFEEGPAVADQRTALGTLWAGIGQQLATSVSWEVQTTGRVIDPTNGEVTGDWSEPTARAGSGTASSAQPVSDATQVLIQWRTGYRLASREVRGRTYVPGLDFGGVNQGNLNPTRRASMAGFAQTFATDSAGLVVWHRPKSLVPGSSYAVTASGVWSELAVQRGRRR